VHSSGTRLGTFGTSLHLVDLVVHFFIRMHLSADQRYCFNVSVRFVSANPTMRTKKMALRFLLSTTGGCGCDCTCQFCEATDSMRCLLAFFSAKPSHIEPSDGLTGLLWKVNIEPYKCDVGQSLNVKSISSCSGFYTPSGDGCFLTPIWNLVSMYPSKGQ